MSTKHLPEKCGIVCALMLILSCVPAVFANAQDAPPAEAAAAASSADASVATAPASAAEDSAETESSSQNRPSQAVPQSSAAVQPGLTSRDVSERTLFLNVLHDQKDMWLFPVKISRENHWVPVVIVGSVTAALLATDAHDAPFFRQTRVFNDFNHAFPSNVTMSEVLVLPASFYAVGLLTKDPYARKTGLFAAEALADATILSEVIKGVTRQTRPQAITPYGDFSDTFFNAKGDPFSSGFPSGHTISAFAVATVIASRYGGRHRWVPFLVYGGAALIGFSRVTTQAHFPSDVFLGAALGYAIAEFDVLRAPGLGIHF